MNYVDFDLNLIKTFVAVYENGGIVMASKKLYISQPAVTVAIKKLESIVGGKLFVRLPKGTVATKEGEKFYQKCKIALNEIKLGIDGFENFDENSSGSLTIGASHDVLKFLIMPKVVKFLKIYKNVKVNFVEAMSGKLPQYVERGEIDVVFLEDKTLPSNFETQKFAELENVFFAKDIENISEENFEQFDFACYKKNGLNYESFCDFCSVVSKKLQPKFLMSNFETMREICSNFNCIGFAPKLFLKNLDFEILQTKTKISNTKINVGFFKMENLSATAKAFLNFVKNDFEC